MITSILLVLSMATSAVEVAPDGKEQAYASNYALAQPIFSVYYACGEHRSGELEYLGDALGADCVIQKLEEVDGREFARAYRDRGERNADWFGWHADVLSPCDCTVVKTNINPETNAPGILGKPPATYLVLKRADGVHFLLAHLEALEVEPAAEVKAGQKLGIVGNNGYGRNPHIHIGAWHGEKPLQVRFDLGN